MLRICRIRVFRVYDFQDLAFLRIGFLGLGLGLGLELGLRFLGFRIFSIRNFRIRFRFRKELV
jgi:hypothetical protein